MENGKGSDLSKAFTLAVTTVTVFLTSFMVAALNIALPTIGKEFAIDAILLSWVITVYPLTAAAFLVPFGRLADIYGRKRIFTYGVLIYTVSSLLLAISVSAFMLISLRVLQGVGAAMLFTTGIAILTSVFPAGERGRALGINSAAVYIGLSLGPFLGGLLTQQFGWRSIFWIVASLGSIAIVSVLWKLKGEWAGARGDKFDLSGSIIYGITLVAIIYGFSLLPALGGIGIILVGIVGGLAFVWWETRVSSPILNMNLFRDNPVFAFSNLAALLYHTATFAVIFLLSLYLQYTRGFGPQEAGLVLVSMPVVQAVFSPVAGRLSDRLEPRVLASVGMTFTTLGLGLFAALAQDTAIGFILVSLGILGFGSAFFASPNTNAAMSSVDNTSYGVASATLAAMRQVGFTLSMGIAMLIIAMHIGRVEITPEYYASVLSSARTAFAIFAVLSFSGIFISLARGKSQ
ncbi:MAG: MFS transporter [Chloroflexi bacterium]|nr:MFS transporter [Chloroflexota bacterium]